MERNRKRNIQNGVLEDIKNILTSEREMKKGRPSKGDENMERFISHIPPPPTNIKHQESKASLEKNRRMSNIPAPVTMSLNLNLKHINNLIGIKNTLNKKQELNDSLSNLSLRSRLSLVEKSYSRDISKQMEIKHDLDGNIGELGDKIDDLESEVLSLKRVHKKYTHKLTELRNQISYLEKKFEHLEESVMKNVLHKEQMINIQIKEFENRLIDQYNEMKFLLLEELKNAKTYKDSRIIEEIKELNMKIETLNNQLKETKARKEQTIRSESKELERELNGCLENKSDEITKLTNIYQEKQRILKEAIDLQNEIQRKIEKKSKENEAKQESIESLELNLSQFDENKTILVRELDASQIALNSSIENEEAWKEKVENAKCNFNDLNVKTLNCKEQQRIIENSIMDYEGKVRVYAITQNIVNGNTLSCNDKLFQFNKVFGSNISHKEIALEFKYLANSSVNGSNVSIFLIGEHSPLLLENSILESYNSIKLRADSIKNWTFKFCLKSLAIGDTAKDLLNCNNVIKSEPCFYNLEQLHSQKMEITDEQSLRDIFETLKGVNKAKVYILNVEAICKEDTKSFITDIMITDLTYEPLEIQASYLKTFDSPKNLENLIYKLFTYSYSQSKCLFLANISNDIDTSWVQQLQDLNNIASPYKRFR